jgi:hypothetical protein
VRTWDENKTAINQLWPLAQFTDEEKRLWNDDLSGMDQIVLYDAIRNAKRNHDSLYPQIKWIRDEYRTLSRIASLISGRRAAPGEPRQRVHIDANVDRKTEDELRAVVEITTASEFESTRDLIADKASQLKIEMATAYRLVRYLLQRLGMSRGTWGNIT